LSAKLRQPGHGGQFGDPDPQAARKALGAAHLVDGRFALVEELSGENEHHLAFFGQLRRAVLASEQRDSKQAFEFLDSLGYRGLRGVQFSGRWRESAGFDDPVDGFELLERKHERFPFEKKWSESV
jgi:hypothetical protein